MPEDIQKIIYDNFSNDDDRFGGDIEIAWTLGAEFMYRHRDEEIEQYRVALQTVLEWLSLKDPRRAPIEKVLSSEIRSSPYRVRIEELEKENEALKYDGSLIEQLKEELRQATIIHQKEVNHWQQQIQELKERKGPEWDSTHLIGRVRDRHKELEEKGHEYRAFYSGWMEGRVDMLKEIVFDPSAEIQSLKDRNDFLQNEILGYIKENQSLKEENARLRQESEVLKMLRNDEPSLKEMED